MITLYIYSPFLSFLSPLSSSSSSFPSPKMDKFIHSRTRFHPTQFLLCFVLYQLTLLCKANQVLQMAFKATPDNSISTFQPLLTDSTANFSLGFLRVDKTQLALAILHVPSSEPLWLANPNQLAQWSDQTQLFFNGSLVFLDPKTNLFWSTRTQGDRVVLLTNSNLQIQNSASDSVLWQSFDYPTDSIVENQNFTVNMTLISSNGLYSMQLGDDFLGLYAKFEENANSIYWKHTAMEAKAKIVPGQGPIHARISPDGYLGMYQNSSVPVDVQPFNTFQRPANGLLRIRLNPNGDLKGYYWDGSKWVLNYQAITDSCELPSACGSYGLCMPGSDCSCLDNRTDFNSSECLPAGAGDFCREAEGKSDYWVLRRNGVEFPYKELMDYEQMSSLDQCEKLCEEICNCWGAVFNNVSGFCYMVYYPVQTLVGVNDNTKVGYFKVRNVQSKKTHTGLQIGIGLLAGAVLIFIGSVSFAGYRRWKKKRGIGEEGEDGIMPGPYKNIGSDSFSSIEMNRVDEEWRKG